jgi:hypothetical protein
VGTDLAGFTSSLAITGGASSKMVPARMPTNATADMQRISIDPTTSAVPRQQTIVLRRSVTKPRAVRKLIAEVHAASR